MKLAANEEGNTFKRKFLDLLIIVWNYNLGWGTEDEGQRVSKCISTEKLLKKKIVSSSLFKSVGIAVSNDEYFI